MKSFNTNQNFADESEVAKHNAQGYIAPEPSYILATHAQNLLSEIPNEQSEDTRQVLDHMVRLDFELNTKEGATLISFHQAYQDYLDQMQMIDPAEAKILAYKNKTMQEHQSVKSRQVEAGAEGESDLEGIDDPSGPDQNPTKYRFDNVIKSMVARLELYNGLAPVQEYGRHLTQINKKKKPQKEAENADMEESEQVGKNNINDQYYDLDDGFIDDDEIGIGLQEELCTELMANKTDFKDHIETSDTQNLQLTELYERREKQETERIIQRFKVILPAQIDLMLNRSINEESGELGPDKDDSWSGNQNNKQSNEQTQDKPQQQSQIGRKREREEAAFGQIMSKPDEPNLESLLQCIKSRVLNGETLKNFSKEINQLLDFLVARDPKLQDRPTEVLSQKLASILQKSEQEMLYMLRRTFYFNKRRERKVDLDKTQSAIKQQIELTLKQSNKRGDSDIVDLSKLKENFCFNLKDMDQAVISLFKKELNEYIAVNNEYLKNKSLEEKSRAKKPKLVLGSTKSKYEQTSFDQEMDRIFKELTANIDENAKPRLVKLFLMPLFGIFNSAGMPSRGIIFNQIVQFPLFTQGKTSKC